MCVTKVIICVFTPIVVYRTLLDAGVENMISVVGNMISVTLSKKKVNLYNNWQVCLEVRLSWIWELR